MSNKQKNQPQPQDLSEEDQQQPANDQQAEIDDLTADLKRLQADFVNFRDRAEQERLNATNTGKADVIFDLLPVLDNLDRAIAHQPEELKDNTWVKGVASVSKQLTSKLNELGLTKIEALGQEFNPDTMEAVGVEGEGEKEIVSEEMQGGYLMNGEIIRAALVKIERTS